MQKWNQFLRTAAGAMALGVVAGCVGVPDEAEMRTVRTDAATERLADLQEKRPTEGSVYLSGELSLASALEKAMELNLSLQRERQGREIARGRVQASWNEALPSVDLTGRYTRLDDDLSRTVDGVETRGRFLDRSSVGLRATQPLFNGRIGAALRAAELYRLWAETGIRGAEEEVWYDVVKAYYSAVLSAHLLEVKSISLETAEAQLADAKAKRRQGMASNYEELRAQVEVSNFQAETLQAKNNKDVAYTALFRLVGASPESEVTLTDSIPLVPEAISFEDALSVALARRADLAEAEYAVRMQRESVVSAKSRYLPEVSAFATQDWASPDPHDASSKDWGDEWTAGVEVSLPVFDGFGRRGALVQERATLRQLEIALRDTEEMVVSEIRQLVLSLKTAEEFAHSQSQNLETAQEALRLVQAGLREGQNTQVEVMDARQALTTASANYYQSLFDHAMVRVRLQKAMGLLEDGALPESPVLRTEADVATDAVAEVKEENTNEAE